MTVKKYRNRKSENDTLFIYSQNNGRLEFIHFPTIHRNLLYQKIEECPTPLHPQLASSCWSCGLPSTALQIDARWWRGFGAFLMIEC